MKSVAIPSAGVANPELLQKPRSSEVNFSNRLNGMGSDFFSCVGLRRRCGRNPHARCKMTKWTRESALAELDALIGEIPSLRGQRRFSAAHTRWGIRVLQSLEQIFGQQSRFYLTFAQFKWYEAGSFMVGGPGALEDVWDPQAAIDRRHQAAFLQRLESARGLLQAARDELERSSLEEVYEGKDTGPESSGIIKVLNLVERKLRKLVRGVPKREVEVQDALENLLIAADLDYSRESDAIEYSSKTYTPDFTLARLDLAIEAKLCPKPEREKELIPEINDDILAYQTKYGNLLFVVYDLGFIRDVERFASSFEGSENVLVRVVKH